MLAACSGVLAYAPPVLTNTAAGVAGNSAQPNNLRLVVTPHCRSPHEFGMSCAEAGAGGCAQRGRERWCRSAHVLRRAVVDESGLRDGRNFRWISHHGCVWCVLQCCSRHAGLVPSAKQFVFAIATVRICTLHSVSFLNCTSITLKFSGYVDTATRISTS